MKQLKEKKAYMEFKKNNNFFLHIFLLNSNFFLNFYILEVINGTFHLRRNFPIILYNKPRRKTLYVKLVIKVQYKGSP